MVRLTDYEQRMFDGEMGPFKQLAIHNIVKYAQVLGASELCEVTKATLFLGAHSYLEVMNSDDYNEIFSEMYMCSDKAMPIGEFDQNCTTQTDVSPCCQYIWEPLNFTKEAYDKNQRYLRIAAESGVSIANSCTPYFTGWIPVMGEHFVTTESSNVLMCNSVFGARGNSDGLEAAVWSAVCGRTPKWGRHVSKNRFGTHVFNIECKAEVETDWDIIGYTIGRMLPFGAIPIISGNFPRPDIVKLKQCFAALATTSGAEICHIVGITPEAPTLEAALGGKEPIKTFTVTQEDYDVSFSKVCDKGSGLVQLVSLGCPHYSLQEIKQAANYLQNNRVAPETKLLIWTDLSIKAMADASGYTKMIEDAGAWLVTSSCPLNVRKCCEGADGMVFDSAKQAHYLRSESGARIYFGDKYRCIDAAISGRWEETK